MATVPPFPTQALSLRAALQQAYTLGATAAVIEGGPGGALARLEESVKSGDTLALQAFRRRVRAVAEQNQEEMNWCDFQFNNAMRTLGLPSINRRRDVVVDMVFAWDEVNTASAELGARPQPDKESAQKLIDRHWRDSDYDNLDPYRNGSPELPPQVDSVETAQPRPGERQGGLFKIRFRWTTMELSASDIRNPEEEQDTVTWACTNLLSSIGVAGSWKAPWMSVRAPEVVEVGPATIRPGSVLASVYGVQEPSATPSAPADEMVSGG